MSRHIIPSIFGFETRRDWDYPSRFYDRNYGFGLADDDFFAPTIYGERALSPRLFPSRQVSVSGKSEVLNNADKFQVMVDVSHFSPEEITVKTVDHCVVVQAKHEERADEHGLVSREFTRKYVLPKDVQPEKVASSLSSDGVLTVEAPKNVRKVSSNERFVTVSRRETPIATGREETVKEQK